MLHYNNTTTSTFCDRVKPRDIKIALVLLTYLFLDHLVDKFWKFTKRRNSYPSGTESASPVKKTNLFFQLTSRALLTRACGCVCESMRGQKRARSAEKKDLFFFENPQTRGVRASAGSILLQKSLSQFKLLCRASLVVSCWLAVSLSPPKHAPKPPRCLEFYKHEKHLSSPINL